MEQPVTAPPSLSQAVLVGIAAGFATAFMSGLLTPGVAPVVFLSLIAPLPLFIAGFGWHPLVAALGGLVAALTVNLLTGAAASFAVVAMLGLPAFAITFISERQFGRYDGRPTRDGIELGRQMITLILYTAIVATVSAMVIEPDFSLLQQRIRKSVEAAYHLVGMQVTVSGSKDLGPLFDLMTGIMLPLSGLLAMATVVVSATLGAMIAERSGRIAFIRPDLYRFRLPGGALILIGIAFIVGMREGYVGLLAEMVALGLAFGFMLQGLAVVHARTLGMEGRGFILAALWAVLIFFGVPALLFILAGMADHLFDFRRGRL